MPANSANFVLVADFLAFIILAIYSKHLTMSKLSYNLVRLFNDADRWKQKSFHVAALNNRGLSKHYIAISCDTNCRNPVSKKAFQFLWPDVKSILLNPKSFCLKNLTGAV